jgi:hypothetical protein
VTGVASHASQGRAPSRPWEDWLLPTGVIAPAAAVLGVVSLVLGLYIHHLPLGLLGVGVAIIVELAVWGYWHLVSESVTMWKRLDEAIVDHDNRWRPKRPRVTRTNRGIVVVVSPVPSLDQATLSKAIEGVAHMYGLHLVGYEVKLPKGFARRSVGRESLRIEISR